MKDPTTKKTAKFLSLSTYATEDQIEALLRQKSAQLAYASLAHHDKDLHKDGKPKEPHTHINLQLLKERKIDDILEWFAELTDSKGQRANTRYELTINTKGAEDYLLHDTDEAKKAGKYQYSKEVKKVLVGNTDEYVATQTDVEAYRTQKEQIAKDAIALREAYADDVEEQLQAVIDGVPFREMARRYGRDYIKNWRAYKEYASNIVFEETQDIAKALAVQSSLLEQEIREREINCLNKGYKAGTKDALNTLSAYLDSEVANGASYLKEVAELVKNMNT